MNIKLNNLTATWTNLNGDFMVRTNRQLTQEDKIKQTRTFIDGSIGEVDVWIVEVQSKSGAIRTVEISELEKRFPDSFVYSFRSI